MTILSAASLFVLCFLGSAFLLVMLMALVAWITDEDDNIYPTPPTIPAPKRPVDMPVQAASAGMFVYLYYYRQAGRRKYLEPVKGFYFKSAFELFDVVLDACLQKRKRVRAKDWKVTFGTVPGVFKLGDRSILINASEEEVDEFCGACWEELNKRLSK